MVLLSKYSFVTKGCAFLLFLLLSTSLLSAQQTVNDIKSIFQLIETQNRYVDELSDIGTGEMSAKNLPIGIKKIVGNTPIILLESLYLKETGTEFAEIGTNAVRGGDILAPSLKYKPTWKSTLSINSEASVTTSFIRKFDEDVLNPLTCGTCKIIDEVSSLKGNHLNIYSRYGRINNNGGYNVLNEDLSSIIADKRKLGWTNREIDDFIWKEYNEPWFKEALERGDNIYIISDPINNRTGFFKRELDYFEENAKKYGYDEKDIMTGFLKKKGGVK